MGSTFIRRMDRMDLRLPMVGGKLSYDAPYKYITIDELPTSDNKNDLTAIGMEGMTLDTIVKSPTHAILLVDKTPKEAIKDTISDFGEDTFNSVLGISWYAAVKLIKEVIDNKPMLDKDSVKKFIELFFYVEPEHSEEKSTNGTNDPDEASSVNADDEADDTNAPQKVVIGFLHGVHAYMIANKIPDTPSLKDPIEKRYEGLKTNLTKLTEPQRQIVKGIWNALHETFFHHTPADDQMYTDVFKNEKSLETFLGKTDFHRNNAPSLSNSNSE
jgi:hypothetical protein